MDDIKPVNGFDHVAAKDAVGATPEAIDGAALTDKHSSYRFRLSKPD